MAVLNPWLIDGWLLPSTPQVAAVAVGDVAAAGDGAASRVLGKPHWPPAHEIPEDLDDDEIRIPR